ncbi:MAG TPA: DUF3995 domain-containing protein [Roseiarcus sp.]|nr:DUF3995 domain-containing protein [Roseiarcus sp.]
MIALAYALVLALTAIAAVHFYWGAGGFWPAADEAGLIDTVLGDWRARTMPPRPLTFVVAIAIEAAALVAAFLSLRVGGAIDALFSMAGAVLCLVFLARFSLGYLGFWRRRYNRQPFARLDRLVYSPLCLAIAAGFALLVAERL